VSRAGLLALNLLAYQCTWFAAVLGAATGRPATGIAFAGATVLWHLYAAPAPVRELKLVSAATFAGAAFEYLLQSTGWIRVTHEALPGGSLPLWMVALWGAFATTLNVSLRALRDRTLLCALVAGLGAPLAYAAGARLGALQLTDGLRGLLLVGAGWALLMPLLMRVAKRLDGFATP
jgi:hypothetical protein